LYKTFVTKKALGGKMFYEYLLLVDECAQHVFCTVKFCWNSRSTTCGKK